MVELLCFSLLSSVTFVELLLFTGVFTTACCFFFMLTSEFMPILWIFQFAGGKCINVVCIALCKFALMFAGLKIAA